MPAETETTKVVGFKVPCPNCGEKEALRVVLHDFSIYCPECDNETTADYLRGVASEIARLVAWLDMAATV